MLYLYRRNVLMTWKWNWVLKLGNYYRPFEKLFFPFSPLVSAAIACLGVMWHQYWLGGAIKFPVACLSAHTIWGAQWPKQRATMGADNAALFVKARGSMTFVPHSGVGVDIWPRPVNSWLVRPEISTSFRDKRLDTFQREAATTGLMEIRIIDYIHYIRKHFNT